MIKIAVEDHDRPGYYEVDGRSVSKDELEALKKLFPGHWITIEWKEPQKQQNDEDRGGGN